MRLFVQMLLFSHPITALTECRSSFWKMPASCEWNVPADQLLGANDVGLVPWVPLTEFRDPPAVVLGECRRRIDA